MSLVRMNVRCATSLPVRSGLRIAHMSTAGKKHFERKLIKQPMATLYEVVSDVSRYKEFVPWCKNSRIVTRNSNKLSAELEVGFNIFSEKYMSNVETVEPTSVTAVSTQTNLFEYLKTEWKFTPASDPRHTWVTFQVDFKFKSAMYNELSKLFLQEVIAKMVRAFEQRCVTISIEQKEAAALNAKYVANPC